MLAHKTPEPFAQIARLSRIARALIARDAEA